MTEHLTTPTRRRPPWWALAGVLVLVAAVLGAVLTEHTVEDRVADRVRCALPAGARVTDVDVTGFAALEVATGHVDGRVEVHGYPVGAARVDVVARFADVPTGTTTLADVPGDVALEVSAGAGALGALLADRLPGAELHDGQVTVSSTLGGTPVEVVVRPVVVDGGVRLDPESVRVGSRMFGAGLLHGLPGVSVPAARELPLPPPLDAGRVDDVRVDGDHVVLDLTVRAADLAALPTSGACA